MSAMFFTRLRAEKTDRVCNGRAIWRLTDELRYRSTILGRQLVVPAGFETDFASVPRAPLAYLLAGDTAHEAAVIHDYLYRVNGCTRTEADAVFREAMAAMGEPVWRRWLMWAAVRAGGWHKWNEYRQET